MDFPSAWKVISIALTGSFGILGLVTEFKDPATKRLTIWGAISLAGILLSSALGIIAQVSEISAQQLVTAEQQQRIAEDTRQNLDISRRTNESVVSLRRLMSPVDPPTIRVALSSSCKNPRLVNFCKRVHASQRASHFKESRDSSYEQVRTTRIWAQSFPFSGERIGFRAHFFCAKRFADLKYYQLPRMTPDFGFVANAENHAQDSEFDVAVVGDLVTITTVGLTAMELYTSGAVAGVTDLASCRLELQENMPTLMAPTLFVMDIMDENREVRLDPKRFTRMEDIFPFAYGYQFDATGH